MRSWLMAKSWSARSSSSRLVAGCSERGPLLRDRVGQDSAQRRQQRCRHGALALDANFRNLLGELLPPIEPQPEFPKQVPGDVGIVRALHSPEPQALLILLQQLQRFFQLLHGRIE